jgi:hypothetical protein
MDSQKKSVKKPIKEIPPPPRKTIQELAQEAISEQSQLNMAPEPQKRKRRTKAEIEADMRGSAGGGAEIPLSVVQKCFEVPFAVIGDIRGCSTWALTPEESLGLAEAMKPAIDQYVIPWVGEHFVLVTAFMALGSIAISKVHAEHIYLQDHKEEKLRQDKMKSAQSLGEKVAENRTS